MKTANIRAMIVQFGGLRHAQGQAEGPGDTPLLFSGAVYSTEADKVLEEILREIGEASHSVRILFGQEGA